MLYGGVAVVHSTRQLACGEAALNHAPYLTVLHANAFPYEETGVSVLVYYLKRQKRTLSCASEQWAFYEHRVF